MLIVNLKELVDSSFDQSISLLGLDLHNSKTNEILRSRRYMTQSQ